MGELTLHNFNSGVLDPSLRQNVTLELWHQALRQCDNFIVNPKGGVVNRAGTKFIGEVRDSTKIARLIPFKQGDQEYILVFNNQYMQVIKNGEFIETAPGVRYELSNPITSTILPRVRYAQDGETLILVEQGMNPKVLTRVTDTNWTLVDIDFSSQVGVPTWNILPAFNIGVGGGANPKTYIYLVTATDANGVEGLPSVFNSFNSPASLTDTYGVRVQWNPVAGAAFYTVYKSVSNNPTGVYGFIGEAKTLFFDDFNLAANMAYQPPEELTPFSIANNKPAAVGFYQQRSIWGGSHINPETVWASKIAEYFSLRVSKPSAADDALTFRLKADEPTEIKHIVSINDLIVLTDNAEFLITEGQDFILTPTTVGNKPQSYNGSSNTRPVVIEDDVLFVQKRGNEIRSLFFTIESSKYIGTNLSQQAEYLFFL